MKVEHMANLCPIEDPHFCLGARCQLTGVCDHNRRIFEARRRGNTFGRYVNETLKQAIKDAEKQAEGERHG